MNVPQIVEFYVYKEQAQQDELLAISINRDTTSADEPRRYLAREQLLPTAQEK